MARITMKREATDPDAKAVLQKRIVFPAGEASQAGTGVLTLESVETGSIEPGVTLYDVQKVIPGSPPVVATLMSGQACLPSGINDETDTSSHQEGCSCMPACHH